MNEQELIRYYKARVVNGSEELPDDAWETISQQLDIDDAWENISFELDIDDVWQKVSITLDHDKKIYIIRRIFRWSATAILILLFTIFSNDRPNRHNTIKNFVWTEQKKADKDSSDVLPDKHSTGQTFTSTNVHSTGRHKYGLSASSTGKTKSYTTKYTREPEFNITPQKFAKSQNNDLLRTTNNTEFSQDTISKTATETSDNYSSEMLQPITASLSWKDNYRLTPPWVGEQTKSSANPKWNRLTLGFTSAIKNTWLINKETIEGLDPQEINETRLKFISDFGFNIRYDLNHHFGIEGVGYLTSGTGQSYNEYAYGRNNRKNVTLKYTIAELSLKYNSKKYFGNLFPLAYNINFGMYLSRLRSARETIGNVTTNTENQYYKTDYGLLIGQEIELFPIPWLSFAPGIRVKWGLPNIYSGSEVIPSSLRRTHNGSIEFRFSLYYHFHKY